MKIIISLFLLLPMVSNAQETNFMNEKSCFTYIQEKIDTLNGKIYNAVIKGDIRAYDSDSFKTTIHKDTIAFHPWSYYDSAIYDSVKSVVGKDPWSDEVIDFKVISLKPIVNFNPYIHFNGISIFTELEIDSINFSKTNRTKFLCPLYPNEFYGILVTPIKPFALDINELKYFLSEDEKAILLLRLSFQDKSEYSANLDKDYYSNNTIVVPSLKNQYVEFRIYEKMEKAMANYLFSLPSIMAEQLNLHSIPIFKDSLLKNRYNNIKTELSDTLEVQVMIENNLDDNPFFGELTDSTITPFSFFTHPFSIHQVNKERIIELKVSQYNKENASIFYKYSSAKHYLQPYDRILLESLFEEMLKQ